MADGIRRRNYGTGHGYTINGAKVMGVTTALSNGFPKPKLLAWAAKCAAREAINLLHMSDQERLRWEVENDIHDDGQLFDHLVNAHVRLRTRAAVRGTKIHRVAQDVVYGKEVEVPIELAGHVAQCARFLDEWKVRPLLVEKVVGNYRYGYAGTFDLIAEIPDGRRILFDYKTGDSGIWPDVALQLAAYRHCDSYVADMKTGLEVPMREVGITEAKAVWLNETGYEVVPLDTGPAVYKAFLHVLQVAKAVEVMEHWRGQPERCPQ